MGYIDPHSPYLLWHVFEFGLSIILKEIYNHTFFKYWSWGITDRATWGHVALRVRSRIPRQASRVFAGMEGVGSRFMVSPFEGYCQQET